MESNSDIVNPVNDLNNKGFLHSLAYDIKISHLHHLRCKI
jgi:hypothetical protein